GAVGAAATGGAGDSGGVRAHTGAGVAMVCVAPFDAGGGGAQCGPSGFGALGGDFSVFLISDSERRRSPPPRRQPPHGGAALHVGGGEVHALRRPLGDGRGGGGFAAGTAAVP